MTPEKEAEWAEIISRFTDDPDVQEVALAYLKSIVRNSPHGSDMVKTIDKLLDDSDVWIAYVVAAGKLILKRLQQRLDKVQRDVFEVFGSDSDEYEYVTETREHCDDHIVQQVFDVFEDYAQYTRLKKEDT